MDACLCSPFQSLEYRTEWTNRTENMCLKWCDLCPAVYIHWLYVLVRSFCVSCLRFRNGVIFQLVPQIYEVRSMNLILCLETIQLKTNMVYYTSHFYFGHEITWKMLLKIHPSYLVFQSIRYDEKQRQITLLTRDDRKPKKFIFENGTNQHSVAGLKSNR